MDSGYKDAIRPALLLILLVCILADWMVLPGMYARRQARQEALEQAALQERKEHNLYSSIQKTVLLRLKSPKSAGFCPFSAITRTPAKNSHGNDVIFYAGYVDTQTAPGKTARTLWKIETAAAPETFDGSGFRRITIKTPDGRESTQSLVSTSNM